ncbi:MAG TPA: twin-arginine translocation signal domain-containing protein, partial [Stellaceae bacterium]|nr:twin-arginine translocation signal domain-containing protein [Stellaceae bacterium]
MAFSAGPSSSPSRRQFLKGAAAGAATSLVGIPRGHAAAKSLTLLHESSFIKTFDAYFQKTLAPEYEKLTGIKINYELASVGGLQTRVTTIAETGNGPELTLNFFNWA